MIDARFEDANRHNDGAGRGWDFSEEEIRPVPIAKIIMAGAVLVLVVGVMVVKVL